MILNILRRLGLPFVLAASAALLPIETATAQSSTPQFSADPERARIERIVREYLLEHPELLVEVMRKLEARQKAQEKADQTSAIKSNRQALFASADDHVVNPKGRIPVVEFFDYQCGYCKRFLPNVARLLHSDDSVRFIFKEFPILGEVSVVAARAALAAGKQGKYLAYHNAVMGLRQGLTEDLLYGVARDVGLDVGRLKQDMQSADVNRVIEQNRALAASMGIRGTPTVIIGDQLVPGAISYDQLLALIEDARQNCAVC